jgi:L,D-transpeptidase catalytic domain
VRATLGACALCCGIFSIPDADASVLININLSSQTMHVSSDIGSYDWKVSTARSGYRTPRGTYPPSQLLRMHYSHKYHMSPMPYSIFFAGGYAIHGTHEMASLGRPVSHGCIRLAPGNAARLFHMVQVEGAKITILGVPPRSSYSARLHRRWRGAGTAYALLRRKPFNALAYAPARRAPAAIRTWQADPIVRSLPQWPTWP